MPPIRCFLGGIDDFVRETDASSPRKRWTQGCRNAERALLLCVGVNVPRASVDNCSTWTAFMRLNRLTLERLPVLVFLQTMELSDAGFCCRIAYGLPFRSPASCTNILWKPCARPTLSKPDDVETNDTFVVCVFHVFMPVRYNHCFIRICGGCIERFQNTSLLTRTTQNSSESCCSQCRAG
jgi:hypothetical protein